MKKLLDDTPDDLTRALLEAGRAHRPPTANHAKLLVTLGVGAGVGLFSSKAFAWLGTSAGKLTALGVGVGVAGAVYVALPYVDLPYVGLPEQAKVAPVEVARVETRSSLVALAPSVSPAVARAVPAPVVAAASSPSSVPALVVGAPSQPRPDSVSSSRVANGVQARRENAPAASASPRRVSRERERTAARRDDIVEPLERLVEGPLPAAAAPSPAVGAPAAAEPHVSDLESEILLVDAMRGAAQRNDAPELRRLVASYRGAFPEGQLRQEVSELALRSLAERSLAERSLAERSLPERSLPGAAR